jgi:hypothetical protein
MRRQRAHGRDALCADVLLPLSGVTLRGPRWVTTRGLRLGVHAASSISSAVDDPS